MRLSCAVRRRGPGDIDFVALGENSLDTLVIGPAGWSPGCKWPAVRIDELPGGQAATAAVACARLGWQARYVGAVGDDGAGAAVSATLIREGVEPVVVTRAGGRSRRAVVLVDGATGDRTVFEQRDPVLDILPGEIEPRLLTQARVLLVDGTDSVQSIHAARLARAAATRTLVDLDRVGPDTPELLRLIDVVVVPEAVAIALAGGGLGEALASIGRQSGAAAVVATMGPEGALGWCPGGEVRAAATPVSVVDTTGAGDAFRAGFAAAWLAGAGGEPDLADLLRDGCLVAGLNCRALGAQAALPSKSEVPERLWGPV